ncbi:MAG: glycosyltransferase family 4 protein [Acidobacteria bacterium]|nr:glycosyltransferase family 4 protein [Acidobacteriota bacterium]
MLEAVLNRQDKQTVGSSDLLSPQRHLYDRRISVCHVCEGEAWAGAEVQVATLLRALSKCSEIALYAIVLREGRLAQELRSFGVVVQVVSERQKSFLRLVSECSDFVNGTNIQVLHSHNYKENLIALLISCSCHVPHLVRTEHGHPEPYSVLRNPKHWGVLVADRLAAKYTAARIVSVSSDLGEYWKRYVDSRRVTILRNAVDLERVSSSLSPMEAKQRLGLQADSFVIGIAARLECIKRHDLFIATAKRLAEVLPKSNFVIAGGGRQEEPLRRLILGSGLQGRVALLGERSDVYDILRAMDILLICSDHEGIPMVMLEAMALGVAVVSRKIGGIPEVIRHGVNGILVSTENPEELAHACMSLYSNTSLRGYLTQVAYDEIHQRYSADSHARSMVELYQCFCPRQL